MSRTKFGKENINKRERAGLQEAACYLLNNFHLDSVQFFLSVKSFKKLQFGPNGVYK